MSSPTYTQFHSLTHPQHAHRHGSVSSTSSTGSSGPVLSSAYRRDSIASAPISPISMGTRLRRSSERSLEADPFGASTRARRDSETTESMSPMSSSPPMDMNRDRRMSREWDASKVPPSKFQRPHGSIWATPASRDGHVARNKIKVALEKTPSK